MTTAIYLHTHTTHAHTHKHRGSDGTKISRAHRGYSYNVDFPQPFSACNHLGFLAKETICYFTINMLNVPNMTTKYQQLVCNFVSSCKNKEWCKRLWAIISPSKHRKYLLYNKMIYSVNANISSIISHKIYWIYLPHGVFWNQLQVASFVWSLEEVDRKIN